MENDGEMDSTGQNGKIVRVYWHDVDKPLSIDTHTFVTFGYCSVCHDLGGCLKSMTEENHHVRYRNGGKFCTRPNKSPEEL